MMPVYLHLLLLYGWVLPYLTRGRPANMTGKSLLDYAANSNATISANISSTPTALLIKKLVTTTFVEKMPAFLATQSARLELVDGNPCYTMETMDYVDVGNLMARKTCWCMTVIDIPITAAQTPQHTTATKIVVRTPVYTTTVTIFANSAIETVYKTIKFSNDEVKTTTRYRFEPSTKRSPGVFSLESTQTSDESDSSTWIPENIISTSRPTNTMDIEPSRPYLSVSQASGTTASLWFPDFTDILPSSPNWDFSSNLSSYDMSLHSLESSIREENFSVTWDTQTTLLLNSTELISESNQSQTERLNILTPSRQGMITPDLGDSWTAGPDITLFPSIIVSSESFSPRSIGLDLEDLTPEVTPIIPPSLIDSDKSWAIIATNLSTLESINPSYKETSPISIEPTNTYVSSTHWNTDENSVSPYWSSENYDLGLDPSLSLSWTFSPSLATINETGLPSTFSSEWPNKTSMLTVDIVTSTASWNIISSDVVDVSCASSEVVRPVSSLPNQNLSDQLSIYQDETDAVSMTLAPLPIPSTTQKTINQISPQFSLSFDLPTTGLASPASASPSSDHGATVAISPSTPTKISSAEFSASTTSFFDNSILPADSAIEDSSASPRDTLSVSVSEDIPREGFSTSFSTSVIPAGSPTDSMWILATNVTYVPTRTTAQSTVSSFILEVSTAKKPATASERDTKYWIQTELRMPPDVNSTDTSTLVKNLAFLYERGYVRQRKRQRRYARPTSIKLIYVRNDYIQRNITLVYVLYYQGQLVPAFEAVEKMRIIREADMVKLLQHGIIVKAKPYEPWTSSALLENREETWYKTKLAWILVLILLLLVLLLLLLLCCLCARTRKRQKAEVKDAEVSSSFSQGEGRFSTNSGITMPAESLRSYRDAVTSPLHFGETGTYRRSESPKFYENQAFEGPLDEPRVRRRPILTQHTFEATFEGEHNGHARTELTPPEVKPRRRIKNFDTEQSVAPNELSTYQDIRIPASEIEIRRVISELASEDEESSGERIAETRRQLESMTEKLNALVDNSLSIEHTRSNLYGSTRQRTLVVRKDYKHRSRSADSIDKYPGVSQAPSLNSPIYRDQPTQTYSMSQTKRSTTPHFLVTIHKDIARIEQRIQQRQFQRTVEQSDRLSRAVQYRQPAEHVMEAIKHELDKAQESNRESFA